MLKRFLILSLVLEAILTVSVYPQGKSVFSGDPAKFKDELILFMGPDLNEDQKNNLNSFITKWDSASFSKENMGRILDLSSQLTGRQMRAVPGFSQFIRTLNDFIKYKRDDAFLSYWLTGMSEILFNPGFTNESVIRYIENTSNLIKENLLFNSGSVKWKAKNVDLKFTHDTVFQIIIKDGTLTCYSQRDSTEIYHATGIFLPDLKEFRGTKGVVTWEKAGFPAKDVYAELSDYTINTTRNSFTCDSAKLMHKTYFREPELGILTDQAASIPSPEKATYPRFETYTKHFRIKDLYKGVNYEGGLAFEGAQVRGRGTSMYPAKITLYRNDTLYIKVTSSEFAFSKTILNSQETAATLYLAQDSIYHSNLGFSYYSVNRQVNLFRTNNPVSGSPFYNSYHNLDMYFENLSWDMTGSKIIISRARGAALGIARFESVSFFNGDYFLRMMGLDDEHPLTRIKKFSEWYYSETFPVSDFAKWLKKSEEYVTGLCIDMANRGFVFYDRTNHEVTIKKKVKDFIDSYAGKKDYDVLSIYSETKAPVDNAVLDLKSYDLTVRGVKGVFLSDSQKVAIYPYGQELTIEKNRSFRFNGVVEAGLFTIFGHDFQFSYDTFKIKLHKIDSIKVKVETGKYDVMGNPLTSDINSLIQLASGELYIDDPANKSGLKSLSQYPIIDAKSASYIFYDRIPGLENIYKKEDVYFKLDPFKFENIDHYSEAGLKLSGEFFGGKILKPMRQFLTIQENNSLGFRMNIPEGGLDVYNGSGKFFDEISMSNSGLIGSGTLNHLTTVTKSKEFKFFPDSMLTQAETFSMTKDPTGRFPELGSGDVRIKWLPGKDEWYAFNSKDKNFNMFANSTLLDGNLLLSSAKLKGAGVIDMTDSRIRSQSFSFKSTEIKADTADYNLKSPSTNGYAFVAENANTDINFALKLARFHLNTDSSLVKFPEVQYISKMTDFEYNMDSKILNMEQKGKSASVLMTPDKLLRVSFAALDKPTFFSTNSLTDTVSFTSVKAKYNVEKEFIEADGINYVHIADALIQPENGKLIINRRAKIDKLLNARLAVNNLHLLHSANIEIESSKKYSGSAVYNYIDENNEAKPISFPEIMVDTMTTTAKGFIPPEQKFMLSPAFSFTGDVSLSARSKFLMFTGAAGIVHDCKDIKSYPVKFKSSIDPRNIMIPVSDKPRDANDNLVVSGSFINIDSTHVYPAFLSAQKAWSDAGLVSSSGVLFYNKSKSQYQITSPEKIVDPTLSGNMVALDRNACILSGEGNITFGSNFDRLKMSTAGKVVHTLDSGKVELNVMLALHFYFSPEALKVMNEEIRSTPSLKSVNLNSELYTRSMQSLVGTATAIQLKEEMDLFGISKNMPKDFNYEILLNDVKLYWNPATSSFRSKGKIGIGFIGSQPVNLYTDGFVEIQRRRSGDMIDIYLKASNSIWYYFSYLKGVMMTKSMNQSYNAIISSVREKDRKDPESTSRDPFTFVIAPDSRLGGFLQRMSEDSENDQQSGLNGIVR
jgi:hypothetical protein